MMIVPTRKPRGGYSEATRRLLGGYSEATVWEMVEGEEMPPPPVPSVLRCFEFAICVNEFVVVACGFRLGLRLHNRAP